ncbi:MAG: undecaprenyl/decaprenyl-phosphate alpha-N-acetylglucosaminyl 1-phosphate transferase [Candidatus Omnitrophica bacterium]|nr:undecaprenyl/decaprenyl-phosphate alpha-N-acetylglucosaminyl 1-phosphate transferase [Candidatus Omnitrophota bacterium]MCG2705304.1 undecaprenyl/decaprenyl-phosphate alpha-N-acetylglucosaminyl 1-phosphate transferase [Candidatus Omnitrophota bacterium]
MPYIKTITVFCAALVSSLILTPIIARFALKINFVDSPSGKKVHAKPTPLLGGVAIYFSFIFAISLTVKADRALLASLVGGTVIMVIGIIDDRFKLIPRLKLLAQFIAAIITIMMGVQVAFIKIPFLSMVFTCLWIVGMTNAFNLIDNINGLCAGIAAIASFFFGVLAFINGNFVLAATSFALMGSALGFLRYNFPKANIFMGDAGSMFLGFMLASIAVAGSWKTSSLTTSLAIPILILGYPIFDVTFVTVMRMMEGRPVSMGGKDHSSHRFAIAIMESIMRSRGKNNSKGTKLIPAIVTFAKGLRTKGEDRVLNRLAASGFKKKRGVLMLYGLSFALGLAALGMTVLGRYFDWGIMIITLILTLLFGIRLGRVRSNG